MNKFIAILIISGVAAACSGKKTFCECISEAGADQLEYTGDCAFINDLSPEDFDSELGKCELEAFELLMK
jgi:hypothetical protein